MFNRFCFMIADKRLTGLDRFDHGGSARIFQLLLWEKKKFWEMWFASRTLMFPTIFKGFIKHWLLYRNNEWGRMALWLDLLSSKELCWSYDRSLETLKIVFSISEHEALQFQFLCWIALTNIFKTQPDLTGRRINSVSLQGKMSWSGLK